jgi:hypothetical protein
VKPDLESLDVSESQRKEVEEQRPFRLGGKGYELALLLGVGFGINILKVCGFTTQTGSVINYLAI